MGNHLVILVIGCEYQWGIIPGIPRRITVLVEAMVQSTTLGTLMTDSS